MDTTLWIIVAVVVVIVTALLVYRYGREIGLNFKGWGVQAKLQAKGEAPGVKLQQGHAMCLSAGTRHTTWS